MPQSTQPAQIRIAIAQINTAVGNFAANASAITEAAKRAAEQGAHLLVTPEMALVGYPAEDWLLRNDFCDVAKKAQESLVAELGRAAPGLTVLFGTVLIDVHGNAHERMNGVIAARDGVEIGRYAKHHLPEYGVFDETRVFTKGEETLVIEVAGVKAGVCVCEDLWYRDVAQKAREEGAQLLVSLNASPYCRGKRKERETVVCANAAKSNLPLVYVNQIGGQDELIFDGRSFVSDICGRVIRRLDSFKEDFAVVSGTLSGTVLAWDCDKDSNKADAKETLMNDDAGDALYEALVLATRDYVKKNGFTDVTLGLSGGVDSALVATIAADALGADHVWAVMMPTRFTADLSLTESEKLVENLGIHYVVREIEPLFTAYMKELAPDFEGRAWNEAEENLQARIRGILLMAHSNKFNRLVLTTGNKSESAVGYSTLYGDTAGAFAPIRDVVKTRVWDLCRTVNKRAGYERIPESIVSRPPSAELREGQLDEASLPQYAVLDQVIEAYVERRMSESEIIALGIDAAVVKRVIRMIHRNEYKRRQCPVGPKVTPLAFGRDWRFPMTASF